MRKNRAINLIALVCALLLCAGCRLAKPEAGLDAAGQKDRLIGFYATEKPLDLFDFEAYFNDHAGSLPSGGDVQISPEESAAYGGRLYAERVDVDGRVEYQFPDLEGDGLFVYTYEAEYGHVSASGGNGGLISDLKISVGKDSSVEGTMYVVPSHFFAIYPNPVYQSADGSVYLTAGQGVSMSGDIRLSQGEVMTHTMTETYTETDGEETYEETFTAILHLSVMFAPEQIVVQQMAHDGTVIRRDSYAPGKAPETIRPTADCAYLIVETLSTAPDQTPHADRQLLDGETDSLVTYAANEKGYCVGAHSTIAWAAEGETNERRALSVQPHGERGGKRCAVGADAFSPGRLLA